MGDRFEDKLYRYTSLPAALDILKRQRLVLLEPMNWDDENDKGYLAAYKEAKKIKSLRVLCFTSVYETSQHWELFAGGAGVRLTLSREALENDISSMPGMRLRDVTYREITKAKINAQDVDLWPFLKRYPYEGEREVRLIHESERSKISPEISLSKSTIQRLTFHPSTPKPLMKTMRSLVRDLVRDSRFPVTRSTMLNNRTWLNPVEAAAKNLLHDGEGE